MTFYNWLYQIKYKYATFERLSKLTGAAASGPAVCRAFLFELWCFEGQRKRLSLQMLFLFTSDYLKWAYKRGFYGKRDGLFKRSLTNAFQVVTCKREMHLKTQLFQPLSFAFFLTIKTEAYRNTSALQLLVTYNAIPFDSTHASHDWKLQCQARCGHDREKFEQHKRETEEHERQNRDARSSECNFKIKTPENQQRLYSKEIKLIH